MLDEWGSHDEPSSTKSSLRRASETPSANFAAAIESVRLGFAAGRAPRAETWLSSIEKLNPAEVSDGPWRGRRRTDDG